MPRIAFGLAMMALAFAAMAGGTCPASAQAASQNTRDAAIQAPRPRITIHPRETRPGPNSTRQCRSWLAQEYRVSGPVIVPRMQCWWQ